MGTRSRIGYLDPKDGLIHSIYCHWDGYISNNGRILLEHYKDLKKIKRLVALGCISSLEKHLSPLTAPKPCSCRYNHFNSNGDITEFTTKHTFDTPVKDVTVAYHRDRGEAWDNVKPNMEAEMGDLQEYNYLYIKGKWYVKHEYATPNDWTLLSVAFKEKKHA